MRNYFHSITRPDGFILVHVLFIVSLSFLLIGSTITFYHNELSVTERQIEQTKMETLFQMGRAQYIQEQNQTEELLQSAVYDYPDGTVTIRLLENESVYRELNFYIVLKPDNRVLAINHLLSLNQIDD